jgi:hypothetical protein
MAKAGWCDACSANVWVTEEGACPNGHDATHVSDVYEASAPDPLKDAADTLGDAADTAAAAVSQAWEGASPAAKDAANTASDAAEKAVDAAANFGRTLFGGSGASTAEPTAPADDADDG